MAVVLNPYLGFSGQAREALEFYHAVFGGDLSIMTWGQGGLADDPQHADLVQHGQVTAPDLVLMASDSGSSEQEQSGSSVSVSLSGDDEARLRAYWDALAVDATIAEPLTQAPWGDIFGMLTDRFGTAWMVNISAPDPDRTSSGFHGPRGRARAQPRTAAREASVEVATSTRPRISRPRHPAGGSSVPSSRPSNP